MTDSLLKNEESGEKRAAFFMTLAAAAGGVFAFAKPLVDPAHAPGVAAGVAAILLLLGIMTIRRLAERHKVTDRFIYSLRQIRRTFISPDDAAGIPNAFAEAFEGREARGSSRYGIRKGGWLECVAVVNAVLGGVCATGLLLWAGWTWPYGLPVFFAYAFLTWMLQIDWSTCFLKKAVEDLRAIDEAECRAQGALWKGQLWTRETRKERYVGTPPDLGVGAAAVVGQGVDGGAGSASPAGT